MNGLDCKAVITYNVLGWFKRTCICCGNNLILRLSSQKTNCTMISNNRNFKRYFQMFKQTFLQLNTPYIFQNNMFKEAISKVKAIITMCVGRISFPRKEIGFYKLGQISWPVPYIQTFINTQLLYHPLALQPIEGLDLSTDCSVVRR